MCCRQPNYFPCIFICPLTATQYTQFRGEGARVPDLASLSSEELEIEAGGSGISDDRGRKVRRAKGENGEQSNARRNSPVNHKRIYSARKNQKANFADDDDERSGKNTFAHINEERARWKEKLGTRGGDNRSAPKENIIRNLSQTKDDSVSNAACSVNVVSTQVTKAKPFDF